MLLGYCLNFLELSKQILSNRVGLDNINVRSHSSGGQMNKIKAVGRGGSSWGL